jgi:hypothetical protein
MQRKMSKGKGKEKENKKTNERDEDYEPPADWSYYLTLDGDIAHYPSKRSERKSSTQDDSFTILYGKPRFYSTEEKLDALNDLYANYEYLCTMYEQKPRSLADFISALAMEEDMPNITDLNSSIDLMAQSDFLSIDYVDRKEIFDAIANQFDPEIAKYVLTKESRTQSTTRPIKIKPIRSTSQSISSENNTKKTLVIDRDELIQLLKNIGAYFDEKELLESLVYYEK